VKVAARSSRRDRRFFIKKAEGDFAAAFPAANLRDPAIALGGDSAIHHVPRRRGTRGKTNICTRATSRKAKT